jgi:hypothetical protein
MVLTALRLPGNIEQRLADIQTRLFAELGLLCARALPPLVPLAWGPRERRGAPPARIPPLTLGGVELAGSVLLVPVAPAAPVSALAAAGAAADEGAASGAAAGAAGDPGAPFPIPPPGVLLAPAVGQEAARAAAAIAVGAAERAAVAGVLVRRFALVEIEILTWHGEEPEYVVWREVSRAALRATPRR